MSKLVVGCGYLGARVAHLWANSGETVYAITRSPDRANDFAAQGWVPIVVDITQPNSLTKLPETDTVLFAVGFDRTGKSIHEVYAGGLANVLNALSASVGRVVYISSTGVFGQTDGDWVTEESLCRPTREGGKACLAAEELLRAHPLGERSIILRLAGLYGPRRIPRRDDLLSARPIPAPSEGWLNLIHVDDAARIVLAVEKQAPLSSLYLVSDGAPVLRRDYYAELARLLGAPEPRFESVPSDSPAALRATADKRISNAGLRSEIEFTFEYPSYRDGLAAIVRGEMT